MLAVYNQKCANRDNLVPTFFDEVVTAPAVGVSMFACFVPTVTTSLRDTHTYTHARAHVCACMDVTDVTHYKNNQLSKTYGVPTCCFGGWNRLSRLAQVFFSHSGGVFMADEVDRANDVAQRHLDAVLSAHKTPKRNAGGEAKPIEGTQPCAQCGGEAIEARTTPHGSVSWTKIICDSCGFNVGHLWAVTAIAHWNEAYEEKHSAQMNHAPLGQKYDNDKPRYHLMPRNAEREVVNVLTYGAQKYDEQNWRKVSPLNDRYYSAARRHFDSFLKGEQCDPESGLHHLAHAACCVLFMLENDLDHGVAEVPEFLKQQAD